MKKIILAFAVISLAFISCDKETKKEINYEDFVGYLYVDDRYALQGSPNDSTDWNKHGYYNITFDDTENVHFHKFGFGETTITADWKYEIKNNNITILMSGKTESGYFSEILDTFYMPFMGKDLIFHKTDIYTPTSP